MSTNTFITTTHYTNVFKYLEHSSELRINFATYTIYIKDLSNVLLYDSIGDMKIIFVNFFIQL